MHRIGRKKVLIFGMGLGGAGMFTLGLVELSNYHFAVFFSILSRLLAGIGAGCSMTAAPAILVSEFPEEVERVIGLFEAASGLGFLAGPLIGSLLNLGGIFLSFSMTSIFYTLYAIFCYFILGTLRISENYGTKVKLTQLLLKPVKNYLEAFNGFFNTNAYAAYAWLFNAAY